MTTRNLSGLPFTHLTAAATEPVVEGVVTIPDVELVAAGSWLAAAGDGDVTDEDLDSMVAAAADPEVDAAALRIGHVDPRFDGEPSLGWITNVRRDGAKLLGDLAGVPAKLADIMPAAFRRRSVEMSGSVDEPVTTASGKTYRRTLSGLALLGIQRPAVKGLADVLALYASANTAPGTTTILAEVSLDDVRRGAVEAVSGAGSYDSPGSGWVTELFTDAAVVEQYDDATRKTRYYRVPYVVDSTTGAVTYGEAVEVRQTWVPMTAASAAAGDPTAVVAIVEAVRANPTRLPGGDTPHAPRRTTFADNRPPASHPARDESAPDGGDPMAQITDERLRELLGIEADADIEAAITGLKAKGGDGAAAAGDGAPAGDKPADAPAGDKPAEGAPVAPAGEPAKTPELATLSAGSLAQLRADATEGRKAARTLAEQELAGVVRTALSEGRIAPTEVDLFLGRGTKELDAAEKAGQPFTIDDTKTLLSGLAARFPTTELGDATAPTAAADAAWDEFSYELGVDRPRTPAAT